MIWPWLVGGWIGHALGPSLWLRRWVRTGGDGKDALALTFDDGPDPNFTPAVLEILASYQVKATFFAIGARAERHPDLVRAVVAAGHDLGTHSFGHQPPWLQLPVAAYRDQMRATEAIARITGERPKIARAPWGSPNSGQWSAMVRAGQVHVPWTVHPYDWWPGISAGAIHRRVIGGAHPGGVVLLHDGRGFPGNPAAMLKALPEMIEALQERFRLVPLREWLPGEGGAADVAQVHLGSV